MQVPPPKVREQDVCNVADCLMSEGGSLLACMELTERIAQRRFREGSAFELADLSDAMIAIVGTGAISLERVLRDGRRQVVGFMFRGDILTASEYEPGLRVSALTDGVMYHLDSAVVERCRARRADGRHWRTALIGAHLAEATTQAMMLGQLTARERVASFLMCIALRIGAAGTGGILIELPMSREHIADHLGLKPETVSRQLSDFRREGLIRLPKPSKVEITDRGGLAAMSPLVRTTA